MKKTLSLCFVLVLLSSSLMADQSSELQELETRIAELEKRVAELEALLEAQKPTDARPKQNWDHHSLWRELGVGMSKYQVKAIFGEPQKTSCDCSRTYWNYSKDSWNCCICFDEDDKVFGWYEPK